jgi:hypothetical protein
MLRFVAAVFLLLQAAAPQDPAAKPQDAKAQKPPLKQEELDQLLAPIALYPDNLLAQVLIASTYPVEIILAHRWYEANKTLKGDALTKALEAQTWDASVKSLIATPPTLKMLNDKIDWAVKVGDAFLGQQKEVMETVQKLRGKAKEAGNLKTDDKMKVSEGTPIVIEQANPQVIYVPTYNPTVVYGTWWYPAYPPYYYYPPGYVAHAGISFGVGLTLGLAWGYAWGGCHWGGNDVDIDINRNTEFNRNIDRNRPEHKASTGGGNSGKWKHDSSHRQGAPYRDSATQQKYGNRAGSAKPSTGGDSFRGRDSAAPRQTPSTSRPSTSQPKATSRPDTGSRTGAFNGSGSSGSATRSHSSRGASSRGGGGGGGRGGGGGGRR